MQHSRRIVIITGALRGLGFHLSKRLIRENEVRVKKSYFKLILTSRDKSKAQKYLDELQAINLNALIDYFPLNTDSEASSQAFADQIKQKYGYFDVIVNNAGVGERTATSKNNYEKAKEILGVNLYGVIQLNEKLLPLLSADGKVLNISSELGKLSLQSSALASELSNPEIDMAYIKKKADEFVEMTRTGNLVGWIQQSLGTSYCASKALLNSYTRFALPKILPSSKQVAIAIHPGWVQTDMGGTFAPLKPDEGIISMHRAIIEFPYGRPDIYNGSFIDEKGEKWDY